MPCLIYIMKYTFNHRKFTKQLLPSFLRLPNWVAYLSALVTPLQRLYDDFLDQRDRLNKEARYNSQIMLFEYLLNSAFDPTSRRINIVTTSSGGVRVNAVLKSEGSKINAYEKDEGFNKVTANLKTEFTNVDFEVRIPSVLSSEKDGIERMVNKYRFAGKQFNIIEV